MEKGKTLGGLDWSKKRCVVLDMDGTVYLGSQPIAGAVDFIRRHWNDLDFYFLTNNTSKAPSSYVHKLRAMGIEASLQRLLTPVLPLVDFLRAQGLRRAYVVGNSDFRRDLALRLPELSQENETGRAPNARSGADLGAHAGEAAKVEAEAVILAYDTELTYEKLARSTLLLQKPEVLFLATHPDLVCPSPEGPLPDVGSLLCLYASATGRKPQHIFGKPDPAVLAPLLARYDKEEMVMVGDRLSTDKKLAENAGLDFILVLSGEARREDLARERHQPSLVVEHLGLARG